MPYRVNISLIGKELNQQQVCRGCDRVELHWSAAMKAGWILFIEWGLDQRTTLLCPDCTARHRIGDDTFQLCEEAKAADAS